MQHTGPLERSKQREYQRLTPAIFEDASIKSVNDIRRVLSDLDPKRSVDAAQVNVKAEVVDVENSQRFAVTAPTKSKSKREIILDGLNILKAQAEATLNGKAKPIVLNGRIIQPPVIKSPQDMWVDPIIKRWLGAYRKGLMVCWDLEGYTYMYDIWEHKLSRVQHDS